MSINSAVSQREAGPSLRRNFARSISVDRPKKPTVICSGGTAKVKTTIAMTVKRLRSDNRASKRSATLGAGFGWGGWQRCASE